MLGDITRFLLNIVFTLYGAVLILRLWLQYVRVPPYNPISRAVFRATDWIVIPLRRLLGGLGGIDWACLVAAWLTALVYLAATMLVVGVNPLVLFPAGLWLALLLLAKWVLNLVVWVTLLMAILSWVNPAAPAMPILLALTEPLLTPIRRALPSLGGLDLSPIVLFVIAQVLLMVLTQLGLPYVGM